ncbi:hypothetical protein QC761_709246 [Podospora bellae-mahoneyi]|uniref:Uncharacterized protein n=1 Tax=Podospora bellae-mahoneyi TaxID=2093777 RepID=A0ABR0F9Z4_9PEZI|nr:hypothetical protein QC761_709246 [Podospora bellae-mahoneyi]
MGNRDKDSINKFVTDFLAQSSNLTGSARWFTYFDTHPTDLETGNSGLWDFKDRQVRNSWHRATDNWWLDLRFKTQPDVPFRYRIASREYHSLSPIFMTGDGKPNAEVMFHGKIHLTMIQNQTIILRGDAYNLPTEDYHSERESIPERPKRYDFTVWGRLVRRAGENEILNDRETDQTGEDKRVKRESDDDDDDDDDGMVLLSTCGNGKRSSPGSMT